ncbi:hypothetical protein Nepgr_012796 [Nepenthes gracilis]|uniref:Uncharacterized protein n=1 Tax=Nepenthes gracilis TaxID=150966 RepID=A0AAD3SGE1_NEPGR|nr:hypothetical protein Nepgr_012796 [Nepenthes gracilis]
MSSGSETRENATLPPRRGQIKVQIFKNLVDLVRRIAGIAGDAGGGSGDATGGGTSVSITPPTSTYNSDGGQIR